ncbi:hypothetical protein [Burkholderia sp. Bp8991]|uniref:hypothetical protein n=1 Tax=Burkholderia sp. Bp8991 TaxID=2184553 RepID=UPI000F5B4276|nr:hypothetical protein [Burkholderia sp. Bp8991]RQS00229.1 hypothetical protein DIE02_27730 [Burkholderia sp. Bp8991]
MNLHSALRANDQVEAAIAEVRSAIQRRADADLAFTACCRNLDQANAALPELDRTAARLQAEAIQCEALSAAQNASKADVSKAVKAADKAALDVTEKKREIERQTAAREMLVEMARTADEAVNAAKAKFTAAVAAVRAGLLTALEDDLVQALNEALFPILSAAKAIDDCFPGGLDRSWLGDLQLVSPRNHRTNLLKPIPNTARLPEQADLTLREIAATTKALQSHKAFVPPSPPQERPKRTEWEQRRFEERAAENAERQRLWDEEEAQREARSKARSTGHSWVVREPGGAGAPQATEINMGPAIQVNAGDGETLSSDWHRPNPD